MEMPKIFKDWGIRANLANIALGCHYAAVLYVVINYNLTYDQVFAVLTESSAIALFGLKWYFEKKKDSNGQNEGNSG